MLKRKINTRYVSEVDQFLMDYDKEYPEKSETQKKEIEKHEKIFKKRDFQDDSLEDEILWENF